MANDSSLKHCVVIVRLVLISTVAATSGCQPVDGASNTSV
jgi:hypothetical protein